MWVIHFIFSATKFQEFKKYIFLNFSVKALKLRKTTKYLYNLNICEQV